MSVLFTFPHSAAPHRSHRALRHSIAACALAGASFLHAQPQAAQQALALEHEGKLAEASAAWRALSQSNPRNPEPLAHLGLIEARQEHYAEAIVDYRKALVLAPGNPALQLNLGLAYFKQGDYRNAVALFDPLARQDPSNERLNILLGMSHYGLNQFAAAAPYLKRASEADSSNPTLLLTLAHSCLLSGQYPCVVDAYHRLIALNAESAEADMLVGEALDEMKDRDGAIRELRAAVAAETKAPNVHFGLGYLLWKNQQFSDAADQFRAELVNDPGHPLASLYLANALIQLGQSDKAIPLLEPLVKSAPKNSMAHLDLGMAYADQHRNPEAIAELKTAAQLNPADVNPHWRLGRLYRAMGRTAEAKAEFDKATTLNKAADERLLKVMSTLPAKKPAPPSQP